MGGSVNVFLRDSERNFYRMTRWTNPLPGFLDMIGHVHDPDKHLFEYMEQWHEMHDDWKDNRRTRNFRHWMTPSYFPSPTRICRSEYGLVFVDYITKTIISCQYYTNIGVKTTAGYYVSLAQEEINLLLEIADKGCLKVRYFDKSDTIMKVENSQHLLDLMKHDTQRMMQIIIDNSPWTIVDLDTSTPFYILKHKIDEVLSK